MHQVAHNPILEGIPNGYGLAYLFAFHVNTIARNPCLSGMEHTVFTCYFKIVAMRSVLEIYPFLRTVEGNHGSIVLKLHLLICGKVGQSLDLISIGKCQECQSFTSHFLLSGMNTVFQSCIHQYCHATILNHLLHFCLLFTQQGTIVFSPTNEVVIVGSNLTIIEREIALLPFFSPSLNHS